MAEFLTSKSEVRVPFYSARRWVLIAYPLHASAPATRTNVRCPLWRSALVILDAWLAIDAERPGVHSNRHDSSAPRQGRAGFVPCCPWESREIGSVRCPGIDQRGSSWCALVASLAGGLPGSSCALFCWKTAPSSALPPCLSLLSPSLLRCPGVRWPLFGGILPTSGFGVIPDCR